jgi:hypothetical protein
LEIVIASASDSEDGTLAGGEFGEGFFAQPAHGLAAPTPRHHDAGRA